MNGRDSIILLVSFLLLVLSFGSASGLFTIFGLSVSGSATSDSLYVLGILGFLGLFYVIMKRGRG